MSEFIHVSLHTKWGLLELKTDAPHKFPFDHPDRSVEHGQVYFSYNKIFFIYLNGKESTVEVWIDERKTNNLFVFPYGLITDVEVALFVKDMYNEFRSSNPLYGDYERDSKGATGKEGTIRLYAHVFFEYIKQQNRDNKIESLLTN